MFLALIFICHEPFIFLYDALQLLIFFSLITLISISLRHYAIIAYFAAIAYLRYL